MLARPFVSGSKRFLLRSSDKDSSRHGSTLLYQPYIERRRPDRVEAGSVRHAEQDTARLVELLLLWDATVGLPREGPYC
jgi:hypothetical protein